MAVIRFVSDFVGNTLASGSSKNRIRAAAFTVAAALLALLPRAAQAQTVYSFTGTTNVGTSAPLASVPVTFTQAGTIASVRILTKGIANLDYTAGTGAATCTTGAGFLAAQSCTLSVNFTPTAPGLRAGAIVLLDSSGTPLGTTFLNGMASGPIVAMIPGVINTAAGSGYWLYYGDGNLATASGIFLPGGIVVDGAGNLYIADSGNNRIRRVDAVTGLISTIAGTGVPGMAGDNGPAIAAEVNNPTGIAMDGAGNLYIADSSNNCVRMLSAATGKLSTIAGTGVLGYAGDGGLATAAQLNSPNGLAFDAAGNLYISDTSNGRVRKVDASGIITTVAGNGTFAYSGDGHAATAASMNFPWGITASPTGDLYIADLYDHAVRKVNSSGVISTVAGSGIQGFLGDGGSALHAQLSNPAGVVLDPAGNLYIADSGNSRIRKVNAVTGNISTIAGSGSQTMNGDAGPADQAGLYGPYALAIDSSANLYIADMFHNRVRMVTISQAVLTFPAMRVDRFSAPLPQTLENDGTANLIISSVQSVQDAAVDAASTTCIAGAQIAPESTCIIGSEFAPTQIGKLVSGSLSVATNAPSSPGGITVEGEVESLDPTLTTISVNTNPASLGGSVTFTASVGLTSGGSTPTGSVQFMDGTTVLGSGTLNSLTTATFTTTSLSIGQHTITAVYQGDANSSPSTSPAIIETLKQSTSLALSTSASSALEGAAVTFTATATGAGGVPTGSIVFQDGGTVIGSGTINASGVATLTSSTLSAGQHVITAVYSGDSGSLGSTSASIAQTIQASTTTLLSSSAIPSSVGASITLTATVTASGSTTGAGTLSGAVTFMDGSTTLGTGAVNASGVATLKLSTLTLGTHTITASYAGATYYAASTSTAIAQLVQQATTSTLLTSSVNPSIVNVAITFTANVTGTGTAPTGAVSFKEGSTVLGSGTLNSGGTATYTTSALAAGTHSIVAVYAGDVNNVTSTSSVMTQTVNKATSATTLAATPNPSSQGVSVQFTAVVTSNGTLPTGAVNFQEGSTVLGTATLNSNGAATWATTALTMGHHTIVAVYQGDTANNGSTSAGVLQSILPQTTVALSSNRNPGVAGASITLTAAVTGQGSIPTGAITFQDGTTTLGTGTLNAQGAATLTVSLNAGTHSIVASYAGDTNNASSVSTTLVQVMQMARTQVALGASAQTAPRGAAVTLTATVTGNGATPGGSATFMDGAQTLGTGIVNASGVATLTSAQFTVGQHTLTAVYSGDTNDSDSTSSAISLSVTQATTALQIVANTNPSLAGAATTFSATLTGGAASPTGTITWMDGATTLGASALSASGSSFFTNALTVGQHQITGVYSGDVNNISATSAAITQTVQQTTTATVQSGANPAISGATVHLTATVVGGCGVAATGTVTFKDAAVVIGTATLSGGTGSMDIATLTTGLHTITVTYSGDTTSQTSTSAPLTQSIVAATTSVTLASGTNPSLAGSSLTLTAHVAGDGQVATGTMTFKDGTATLGTATLSSGAASFTTAALSAGQHFLTAEYSGDSGNQPATSLPLTQIVQQQTATALATNLNPLLTAQALTLNATVTNPNGVAATGTVQFQDGSTSLGSASLDSSGVASLTVPSLSAGQHTLTATYGGDTLNLHSSSIGVTEPVQLRTTTTTLAASATTVTTGQQLTLFAAVLSTGPVAASGIVTFSSGNTVIGSATLSATGAATYTFAPTVGTYNVTASYAGDSIYSASVSAASGIISITNTAQVTLTSDPPAVSVASKQYSVLKISMVSVPGFTDTMQLGCLGLPSSATCTFSSDTVKLGSASTQTVQLTLDTGSPLTAGGEASLHQPVSSSRMLACALPGGILFSLLLWSARRNRRYLGGLLLLLLTAVTFTATGCGALQINGTPAGTYNIQVTAKGINTGVTESVNVTLTVTQ